MNNVIESLTLGQHKGLHLGGLKEPLCVTAIDPIIGDVTVSPKAHPAVERLTAGILTCIVFEELTIPLESTARCRSNQAEVTCLITPLSITDVSVQFKQPQYSPTLGQSIVFSHCKKCIGS